MVFFSFQEDDQQFDVQEQAHDVGGQELVARKPANTIPSSNHKLKKKKKKNKDESKVEKSLDSILEELSINTKPSNNQSLSENVKALGNEAHENNKNGRSSVLIVNPKYLKAENELRKIFGSKVVNSFENQHSVGSSRQMHGGRQAAYNLRKTYLASPSGLWPRWDNSITMELLETKDGMHYFRYPFVPCILYR